VTECAVYRGDTRERVWHGDLDLSQPQTVVLDEPIPGPVTIIFAYAIDEHGFRFAVQSAPSETLVTKAHVPPLLPPVGSVTLLAPIPWLTQGP
jgi:hypothetical protein